MSKYTLYLLVYREDETQEWMPWAYFCRSLGEAQQKIIKISRGSSFQYDIVECTHIWKKMVDTDDVESPTIVKEESRVSGHEENNS